MVDPRTSILARVEWCRWQRTLAFTWSEMETWRAEEEGLLDALLNRDHTRHYRYRRPDVFDRYMMGVEDGTALIRLAYVKTLLAITYE